MTDLHTQLHEEINRRLAVAKAATPGPWRVHTAGTGIRGSVPYAWITDSSPVVPFVNPIVERSNGGTLADAEHIALHDPADAIRRYEGELEVLERHAPCTDDHESGDGICSGGDCHTCAEFHPCPELQSLAHRLGVSVDG